MYSGIITAIALLRGKYQYLFAGRYCVIVMENAFYFQNILPGGTTVSSLIFSIPSDSVRQADVLYIQGDCSGNIHYKPGLHLLNNNYIGLHNMTFSQFFSFFFYK